MSRGIVKIAVIIAAAFILFPAAVRASGGKKEAPPAETAGAEERPGPKEPAGGASDETGRMTVAGTLTVKGNDPHTYLAVTTPDGTEYKVIGPLEEELRRDFQLQKATLTGRIAAEAVGPGFPAEFEVEDYSVE